MQEQTRLLSKDGSRHVTNEVGNTIISSLGAILALVGLALLVRQATAVGQPGSVFAFSVYGVGVIIMFLCSALHHGVNGSPRTNHLLRQFDYFAIFIMIAGTFTPFCLIALKNSLGQTVLALIWALAVIGIALKATYPHIPKWFTLSLYIGMGWLGAVIAKPVYQTIHLRGLIALGLGGFFFTVGGVIYGLEKPNPFPGKFGFHEIWHCFVLAGAASHFYIMYRCFY